ncbi:MAG: hypothetical protein K0S74_337 [Chlamydiales bacterium]|jgi:hypothetical protein|nr:hypothetical protein [Chlamydiales bacterium]
MTDKVTYAIRMGFIQSPEERSNNSVNLSERNRQYTAQTRLNQGLELRVRNISQRSLSNLSDLLIGISLLTIGIAVVQLADCYIKEENCIPSNYTILSLSIAITCLTILYLYRGRIHN